MAYRKFARMVIEEREPEKAMSELIKRYDDPIKCCQSIYSMWSRVRSVIAKDENNRNKYYHDRMKVLLRLIPRSSPDYDLVKKLKECGSLAQQHQVHASRRKFLSDLDLDKKLKLIKPLKAVVYRFVLPPEIASARNEKLIENAKRQQFHQDRPKEEYVFSSSEVEGILTIAKETLDECRELKSYKRFYELVVALQVLSGRRNIEILSTLVAVPSTHPYQLEVAGIAKKSPIKDYGYCVIPLLVPSTDFIRGLGLARDFLDYKEPVSQEVLNSRHSNKIGLASRRIFGRKLTHTMKRNIYLELAYKRRDENGYLVGDQSCSKSVWCAMALCHDDPMPSVVDHYQAMLIE